MNTEINKFGSRIYSKQDRSYLSISRCRAGIYIEVHDVRKYNDETDPTVRQLKEIIGGEKILFSPDECEIIIEQLKTHIEAFRNDPRSVVGEQP